MESDMRHGGDSMAILGMLKNRNITARTADRSLASGLRLAITFIEEREKWRRWNS